MLFVLMADKRRDDGRYDVEAEFDAMFVIGV